MGDFHGGHEGGAKAPLVLLKDLHADCLSVLYAGGIPVKAWIAVLRWPRDGHQVPRSRKVGMPERFENERLSLREGRHRAWTVGICNFWEALREGGEMGTFMMTTRLVRRRRWYC